MRRRALTALLMGIAPLAWTLAAQPPQEETRQIIAEEFLKARPSPAKSAPVAKPRYKAATPADASTPPAPGIGVGLTLWRLRPAKPSEQGARLLVQDSASEMIPERIETGAPLAVGDRVRLTIESPSAGSLYVIDREVYRDGVMGDPYVIFPTSRTREGDNAVRAGRLVDIPDQRDRPNYFTVKPSRPGQVGELITIIVTPKPIADIVVGNQPLKLPVETIAAWTKSWSAPVQTFVLEGPSQVWTSQEKGAGADASRLLTQDDPAPQTILRVAAKKGAPLLVNVQLPYAASDR